MRLGLLGAGPAPALVDRLDEEAVPAVEQLGSEGFETVHPLVRPEEEAVVAGLPQEHAAPEVDELGDVGRPVDLRDLVEHRREQVVEHDLAVEPHDQVVDLRPGVEVARHRSRAGGGGDGDLHRAAFSSSVH